MAGRRGGRTPKPESERARRNATETPGATFEFVRAQQPALPAKMPDGTTWPAQTRAWWKAWATDPRAKRFDSATWRYLLDTAVIHGRLWSGEWKAAAELRLRLQGFGVTPGDRARLRVQLDDGLEGTPDPQPAAGKAPAKAKSARARHGKLKVVGGTDVTA